MKSEYLNLQIFKIDSLAIAARDIFDFILLIIVVIYLRFLLNLSLR